MTHSLDFFLKFFFVDLTLNSNWGPTKQLNSTKYSWVNPLRINTLTQKPGVYLLKLLRASHLSIWSISQPFYPPKLLISSRLAGETFSFPENISANPPNARNTLICNTLHVPHLINFVSENICCFFTVMNLV